GHRLRAIRMVGYLCPGQHPATGARPSQPRHRRHRGDPGVPRPDRERGIACGFIDAGRGAPGDRPDGARRRGVDRRVRNAAGMTSKRSDQDNPGETARPPTHADITRRHALATFGAAVASALLPARAALALEPVRQGYQTNMWGMPTYYL